MTAVMTSTAPAPGTPSRTLRVGLIGSGKMGVQHLKAIGATPGATIVGVADPAADRRDAAPAAARGGGHRAERRGAVRAGAAGGRAHRHAAGDAHAPRRSTRSAPAATSTSRSRSRRRAPKRRTIFALAAERGLTVCAGHQYLFEAPSLAVARVRSTPSAASCTSRATSPSGRSAARSRRSTRPRTSCRTPSIRWSRSCGPAAGWPTRRSRSSGLDVRASGDIYALLRLGDVTRLLLVTLSGRPIEQYQNIIAHQRLATAPTTSPAASSG